MNNGKNELLIGGVGTVKGSIKNAGILMASICNELEPIIERTNFLEKAPFDVISLIIRFGETWGEPILERINKKYAELEAVIEVPMIEIKKMNQDEVRKILKSSTIKVLIEISKEYELESRMFSEEL